MSHLRSSFRVLAVGLLLLAMLAPSASAARTPVTPDDGVYRAQIRRTSYGIPHILAEDYGSLGFGQGYAASEDVVCSLADTLLTARGERSKYFGPDGSYTDQVTLSASNLQTDAFFGDIVNQGTVEKLLESDEPGVAPSDQARAMVAGAVAGYNAYLEDVGVDGIPDPRCRGAEWVQPAEEIDLWRGIFAANLLASAGVFVKEIVDAAPPTADGDLGLPVSTFSTPPAELPSSEELLRKLGKDPNAGFGSNGHALGGDVTTTGRGMVLGNPHFPWLGRYRFTQSHLRIPGEYDVAGAMLHGAPIVNIGFNENVAWTHTVSTAYRFTPYEYRYDPATLSYLTTEGPKPLERREVEVELPDGTTVTEDLYATEQGYVLDAPSLLMGWTPASVWAIREANAEHLRTIDVFLEMAKATTAAELLAAQDEAAGMPWVNTMIADRDGNAIYADHSVVPHVTDEMAEECMTPVGRTLFELAGLPGLDGTRANGDCAWGSDEDASRAGIFGPGNLPEHATRGWVMNANDSYWLPNPDTRLEGFDRIIGCERCERSLRSRVVYRYVMDRLDGSDGLGGPNLVSHEQLKQFQTGNRVFGAELAREDDDLQDVCAASGVRQEACEALAAWDGTSDSASRGAILFREFFLQSAARVWEEGFDAERPVETPRNLDESDEGVIDAFVAAVEKLDELGIPLDAPLSEQQLAGDDGARAIPIHGGPATIGNANALSWRAEARANGDVLYPITFGSSHIQAVAFTDDGVEADTILTYSMSDNVDSPHQDDQTELWSREEWVDFPFTEEEIAADLVSAKTVTATVTGAPGGGHDVAASPGAAEDSLPATGGGLALGALAMLVGSAMLRRRRRG